MKNPLAIITRMKKRRVLVITGTKIEWVVPYATVGDLLTLPIFLFFFFYALRYCTIGDVIPAVVGMLGIVDMFVLMWKRGIL